MHATAKNCLVKTTTVQVTAVSGFIEQVGSMINHFNPNSALLVTSYCTLCRKEGLCALSARCNSASAERVEHGEVDEVTCRVTCTWWLLGLAVKVPWLGLGGSILALAAWTGLENTTLN